MLATLRLRNFALLWTAGLISLAGSFVLFAALPLHVFRAHVDFTFQAEHGSHGGRRHAVLTRAGLCNEARFLHAPGEQRLPGGLVDEGGLDLSPGVELTRAGEDGCIEVGLVATKLLDDDVPDGGALPGVGPVHKPEFIPAPLLEASLLSGDAREGYRRILADRARALQIGD